MKKNILIIHYNTPYLTECLVRSINLFVKDAVIYIFDNSNEKPFTAKFDNVTVFGESAGGGSVSILPLVKEAKGLFHRVIAESGSLALTYAKDECKAFTDKI